MRLRRPLLFLTVLIIATSGLVYELLAGTVASYMLGDSVTQFSTTIGVYLFAMGIGSYLSRFITSGVSQKFVEVELGAALMGGASAPLLFLGFAYADAFEVLLYGIIVVIGTLVGLEIPLLMRILREELEFKDLVAKVLTFDYLGALVGSLAFAIVLVPELGLVRTSLAVGLLNAAVGLLGTWVLVELIPRAARMRLRLQAVVLMVALGIGLLRADEFTRFTEQGLYADPIVFAEQSRFQRIVLTRRGGGLQLFLNGNLQFSSLDEHRYHEALVHPAFAAVPDAKRVLILGGGDGLAAREVLRYPSVEEVVLVDLDPAITEMARSVPALARLNGGSLSDPRLTVINDDAMVWLDPEAGGQPVHTERADTERTDTERADTERTDTERADTDEPRGTFDVVVIDFPDPNNFSLGKLYTTRFYSLLRGVLHEDSAVAVQSTSPLFARKSFWCVVHTMQAAGFATHPYHATVPSFGEWGYVLARPKPFDPPELLATHDLRFLTDDVLPTLFVFGADMAELPAEVNRLNNQILVQYYEADWGRL